MSAETYAVLELDCATGSEHIIADGLKRKYAEMLVTIAPAHLPRRIIKDTELTKEGAN